ncbi:hypothetical protein RJ641_010367 [Dillenia turbinata]|uniref:Uncharacterized protein n=1 Tax=Dillenia turbinata TaxID=194707 RepID=A0AAN8Z480_9MAGN
MASKPASILCQAKPAFNQTAGFPSLKSKIRSPIVPDSHSNLSPNVGPPENSSHCCFRGFGNKEEYFIGDIHFSSENSRRRRRRKALSNVHCEKRSCFTPHKDRNGWMKNSKMLVYAGNICQSDDEPAETFSFNKQTQTPLHGGSLIHSKTKGNILSQVAEIYGARKENESRDIGRIVSEAWDWHNADDVRGISDFLG